MEFSQASLLQALLYIWSQPLVKGVLVGFACLWISGIAVALLKGTFTLPGIWDVTRPFTFAMIGGAILQLAVIGLGATPDDAGKAWAVILVALWAKVLANVAQLMAGISQPAAARPTVKPPSLLRTRQL